MRAFACLLLLGSLEAQALEIIAHRGASYDAPENTLPAIELGFERGADAVEIDIHLTQDGKIVAIHDYDTRRVAGTKLDVAGSTLAELKALEAGRWKDRKWAGTRIPTLEEALAAVPDGRRLVIEIKCGEEALPELERVVDASGKRGQVLIIAFSYLAITAAKKRMPDVPAYWLYGFSLREKGVWGDPSLDDLIERARGAGLDGLDLRGDGPFDKRFVDKLRAAGLELYVWTVNDPALARKLAGMGVKGVTTDRPGWLREQLAD